MPALPPAEFVAKATEQGFTFSVKPDGKLGVKPPASGMTDGVRRYVSAMKTELLALLAKGPTESAVTQPGQQEAQIVDPAPVIALQPSELLLVEQVPLEPQPLAPVETLDPLAVRASWDARFEAVATGEIGYTWPTLPVLVSKGTTTDDPARWLRLAFTRYCRLFDLRANEDVRRDMPHRWQSAVDGLEILFGDMLSVLSQGYELATVRPVVMPETDDLPKLDPAFVEELRGLVEDSNT